MFRFHFLFLNYNILAIFANFLLENSLEKFLEKFFRNSSEIQGCEEAIV